MKGVAMLLPLLALVPGALSAPVAEPAELVSRGGYKYSFHKYKNYCKSVQTYQCNDDNYDSAHGCCKNEILEYYNPWGKKYEYCEQKDWNYEHGCPNSFVATKVYYETNVFVYYKEKKCDQYNVYCDYDQWNDQYNCCQVSYQKYHYHSSPPPMKYDSYGESCSSSDWDYGHNCCNDSYKKHNPPPHYPPPPPKYPPPPPKNNGPPPKNNGPPPKNNGPPPKNNGPPPKNNGPPPKNNGPPPKNNGPPPKSNSPPPRDGGHS